MAGRTNHITQTQSYELALADAVQCVRLAPRWGKGYARQAASLVGLGRLDDALSVYTAGLQVRASRTHPYTPGLGLGLGLGSGLGLRV